MSDSNRGAENGNSWATQATGRVGDTIDQAPLVALGAGLAAGALIAALLPTTRRERDLLSPVLGRFTEGLDTRDPIEAKALLGTPARPRQSKER